MATYGNSNKGNKGKKYVKLTGDEVATPENQKRADDFKLWFGENYAGLVRGMYAGQYDDQVFTDTFIYLYDCIALKGSRIDNYKGYFLRAYHTARLAGKKKVTVYTELHVINEPVAQENPPDPWGDFFDAELMEYVRGQFDAVSVSLFEMYVGLQPDITYARLAEMLGISSNDIWPVIGAIKKDLRFRFADRVDALLSTQ